MSTGTLRGWPTASATLLAILILQGCTSLPATEELLEEPAPHLGADVPAGIADGRSEFRQYFCAEIAASTNTAENSRPCDFWLLRLADEAQEESIAPVDVERPLQVLLVPGAFGECFGEFGEPFSSVIAELGDEPYQFATIPVDGRSGTARNATQIARFLNDRALDPHIPLVLIGYSKGTNDILQFLLDYPLLAEEVDAVVSISGAIGGSPVANRYDEVYRALFSQRESRRCKAGDGGVVDALRTDISRAWLREGRLPGHVRYYSMASFTTRDRVARGLAGSWKYLLREGRRNDGALLPGDTLIPNSTVLGYLNADHWGAVLNVEDDLQFFAARPDPEKFPQAALLRAILDQVSADLEALPRD